MYVYIYILCHPFTNDVVVICVGLNVLYIIIIQGSHRLLATEFKVFSRIFKVNKNSQGHILRHDHSRKTR